jgi:hypothetical protein
VVRLPPDRSRPGGESDHAELEGRSNQLARVLAKGEGLGMGWIRERSLDS